MSKTKFSISFIGSGDWGSVFLDSLKNIPDIHLNAVLTLPEDIIACKYKNDNQYYYNTSADYSSVMENSEIIIMAGWQYKIPSFVFENIPVYNIHASLLPAYGGPEPILRQLLNGEKNGGVSIHKTDSGWDTGEIYAQAEFPILGNDDNRSLFFKAARTGKKLLPDFLENYRLNKLEVIKNDITLSYYKKLNPEEYIINGNTDFSEFLRILRAFSYTYPIIAEIDNERYIVIEFSDIKRPEECKELKLKDKILYINKWMKL